MNIFEKFSLAKEVNIEPGKITMDKQRIVILPVNFVGMLSIDINNTPRKARELYGCMKKGMAEFSRPLGKEYMLTPKDFLDRWVKYCAFGGWGLVKYQLLDENGKRGFMNIKDLPMHDYLKNKGIKEPSDFIFEGLIAGSASGTFNMDIDVIETKCICSGNDVCVYYWGSKKELFENFPELAAKRFGDIE